MSQVHKDLGALIREYRIKAKMTQLELSNKLGYDSPQFVSLFERGISKVPHNVIGELIIILGIPQKKIVNSLVDVYRVTLVKEINLGKKDAS
ncbi:MAG: helix-turn-helix transcriptional regulator [Bdellovibrio sp.]|nr:helix-turn-helix transcriptional regulator [Bdellovibrio sp.]